MFSYFQCMTKASLNWNSLTQSSVVCSSQISWSISGDSWSYEALPSQSLMPTRCKNMKLPITERQQTHKTISWFIRELPLRRTRLRPHALSDPVIKATVARQKCPETRREVQRAFSGSVPLAAALSETVSIQSISIKGHTWEILNTLQIWQAVNAEYLWNTLAY